MQYVFFGTPRFARLVLEGITGTLGIPAALVCNPDKPKGRGKTLTPPETKALAMRERWDIPVIQDVKRDELRRRLAGLSADVYLVAAYGRIIPESILALPPHGTIGVHPSLLPSYRGPSPLQSALRAGEKKTGTTLFLLDAKMDHGPILGRREFGRDASALSYGELEEALASLGAALVSELVPKYMRGELVPEAQDERGATYTKLFKTDDAFVPLDDVRQALAGDEAKAETIVRMLRAFTPEPGVWTTDENGNRVKLLEGNVRAGKLVLGKIQYAGGKPRDFEGVL